MRRRVEARPDCDARERSLAAARLAGLVTDDVGVTVTCDVVEPETLARSEGKAVRVLDRRPR